ncbi:MAG: FHA domain-containing protein [Lachnospiraceae bacterium]|nr:FHA domain-containing protein [Lachnospiraceae bacterium]
MKDFLWGMRRVRRQMERFLLDDTNILWHPQQIFQDLEKNEFYFLYVPYFEGDSGFGELMNYLVEHIDHEDDGLIECVYKMHEQYQILGEIYLKDQIYEDGKRLDIEPKEPVLHTEGSVMNPLQKTEVIETSAMNIQDAKENYENRENKKGILYFLEGRRKKQRDERDNLQLQTGKAMMGHAFCEETIYTKIPSMETSQEAMEEEEQLGRTMYMENVNDSTEEVEALYLESGQLLTRIDSQTIILGKKKEEADYVIEDASVSRMHARITRDKEGIYLEDLNSTNGTFKNGLRLQPYEKRRLDKEDEIKLGKIILFFR